ncbi:MAG: glucose-1-phosphate thymidylyltransferase [Candidatus Tectomicrobia bacterium]|nr:glucose-1-phosphate thymidylyltransferase [Candidatus Tectomicrobia bacterium]
MKGLILSGGRGTRLRPITYTNAKQLVPVANKPVLFYGIEALREAGVREVGIIVGDTRVAIEEAVGDGSRWDVEVTYIHQEEPLGLAHAVLTAEEYLAGSPFVMYLGDNLIMGGIRGLVEEFQRRAPDAMVLLCPVPNPTQFGVAELEGGCVVRLEEKPANPKSNLALVGVYMFDRCVFDAARSIPFSARGELEITDAIQRLIDDGRKVHSHIVRGWWKDTGKLEDLLEANRLILDALEERRLGEADAESRIEFRVTLEEGCRVIRSTVRGPVVIGKGAIIRDSYVGPFTSIGDGVRIERAEIEHSILLEGSTVVDIQQRICDSLIGRNAVIQRSAAKPTACRFMVGDYSQVCIQ